LEGGLDPAGIFLVVLFALDPKAFGGCIVSILLLGAGVGFLFRGIIEKLNRLSS